MDFATILIRKYAGTAWSLDGDEYAGLTWNDETPKPTEKELTALWPTVQKEIKAEAKAVEDARLSAIAKLQALGLTVNEVQVAFGLSTNV